MAEAEILPKEEENTQTTAYKESEKKKIYRLAVADDRSPKEIAELTGYNLKYVYQLLQKDRKYGTCGLKDPKNIKKANKTLLKFAQGKEINGIAPKCSTVKDSAMFIAQQDGDQVIMKKSMNLNANLNFTDVDLEVFG